MPLCSTLAIPRESDPRHSIARSPHPPSVVDLTIVTACVHVRLCLCNRLCLGKSGPCCLLTFCWSVLHASWTLILKFEPYDFVRLSLCCTPYLFSVVSNATCKTLISVFDISRLQSRIRSSGYAQLLLWQPVWIISICHSLSNIIFNDLDRHIYRWSFISIGKDFKSSTWCQP